MNFTWVADLIERVLKKDFECFYLMKIGCMFIEFKRFRSWLMWLHWTSMQSNDFFLLDKWNLIWWFLQPTNRSSIGMHRNNLSTRNSFGGMSRIENRFLKLTSSFCQDVCYHPKFPPYTFLVVSHSLRSNSRLCQNWFYYLILKVCRGRTSMLSYCYMSFINNSRRIRHKRISIEAATKPNSATRWAYQRLAW